MVKAITVKLPQRLVTRLSARVKKQQSTQSAVVRDALERYLVGDDDDERGHSFLELASDLAGCIEGPEDLSSNKAYLKGYGQ
jgi:metal-responsive CopG/Arc/MetJ family transcriptional regulator